MSSDEPSAEQLTKFLFVRQPAPIRERLVRQRGIERALGLSSRFVVNIPQFGSLDASLLFQTVREVFKTHNTQHVTCIDGTVLYVTLEDGAVVIRQSADVKSVPKAILQELMLLSPNRAQRDKALKAIVTGLGVAVPDSVHRLALEIAKAPVTDNLLTPLFGEISDGVTATHARIEQAIKRGQSNVTEVVPRSLAYYLNFCGPLPNGRATDEYLSVVLSDFRKELIKRGVTGGLEIALLGGLSVEITPAPWVTDMQKDTLWEAIEKIDPWRDPFSLLNTLDIALDYLEDDRFHDFARRAAEKLTSPVFECGNKNDGFELLPTFAMLVLDQLNDCPETNTCPPFWKRMCAW